MSHIQKRDTIVSETETNDQTANKIIVWFVSTNGDVLIKQISKTQSNILPEQITIYAQDIPKAIKEIENLTGISCDNDCLEKFFTQPEKLADYNVFIVCKRIDPERKEFIEKKSKCRFIDYREIISELSQYSLHENAKEAILTLVASLSERFSFFR